jgi:predicted amidohydrolase
MSITGYIDPRKNPEAVLTLSSHAVKQFCEITKDTSLMAIAGIVEDNPAGKPFITQIIAAEGVLAGWYRKVNVADDELVMFDSADETPIFSYRDVSFGVAICADVGHGDLFAEYAKQGAKIVFAAAAPGLYGPQKTRDWQAGFSWWRDECRGNLSKFAKDGGVNIVVATQAGRTVDEDFPGGGYAFDLNGDVVAETADWTEGILFVQIVTSL